MKKLTLLTGILITILVLSGCSKAEVEKAPITITPKQEQSSSDVLSSDEPLQTEVVTTDNLENTSDSNTAGDDASKEEATQASEEAKPLTILVEGTEVEISGKTFTSSLDYHITYDVDSFSATSENSVDSFMAANPDPDLYPYVYLNISRFEIPDSFNEEASDQIAPSGEDNNTGWVKIKIDGIVGYVKAEYIDLNPTAEYVNIGAYNAAHFSASDGTDWNSAVRDFYLVTTDNYIYVFETQCFVEAQEGYGSRIRSMLDTFVLDK